MTAPKIVTHYAPPPIPVRGFDWCAWCFGEDEETRVQGWGASASEAISDLLEQIEERT